MMGLDKQIAETICFRSLEFQTEPVIDDESPGNKGLK